MNTKKLISFTYSPNRNEDELKDEVHLHESLKISENKKNFSMKSCSFIPSKIKPLSSMVGMKSLRPNKNY